MKLTNPQLTPYAPSAMENQELRWQIHAENPGIGPVQICFADKVEADNWLGFIKEFGMCPPLPREKERVRELMAMAEPSNNEYPNLYAPGCFLESTQATAGSGVA